MKMKINININISIMVYTYLLLGKGSEEKKPYFLWSFAKPGGGGVSEGSEKTILLF